MSPTKANVTTLDAKGIKKKRKGGYAGKNYWYFEIVGKLRLT